MADDQNSRPSVPAPSTVVVLMQSQVHEYREKLLEEERAEEEARKQYEHSQRRVDHVRASYREIVEFLHSVHPSDNYPGEHPKAFEERGA